MFRVPPWGQQLGLFLCYCTRNKLFYGMRHLRLSHAKPGKETWCDWEVWGTNRDLSGPCKGVCVPAVTLWGGGSVAASLVNGQTGKFSEQEVPKSNYQDRRGKKGVLCKYVEVRRE